ncbi:GPP34 family phosphoprotein [Streptomyces sp. NPDC047002]|uniref:GPP34 family phosphoprotein n=1 Tax=Streptomyces sp. NPDC047002 TaxID=3155475 RepID=UPI00345656E0
MTTPRDLTLLALDTGPDAAPAAGELSLGLAAAEALDLLAAGAAFLDDTYRLVPAPGPAADPLLAEAAAALVRERPYEPVGEWLWRRGRDLSSRYAEALASDGLLTRERRRLPLLRPGPARLADSPELRAARRRHTEGEPVLTALARAVGLPARPPKDTAPFAEDEGAVLTALDDAVAELRTERDRRTRRLEEAAADNRRRGY